jgi:hypothetical protein
MRRRNVIRWCALAVAGLAAAGCSSSDAAGADPGLAARGTTMTTAKLSRQDLANKVSLAGKVTMNPVFGLVAPVNGQVRFLEVKAATATPAKPVKVGTVTAAGKQHPVEIPAGATFGGRLVADGSTVSAGMPIVSAKYAGYGIVADIDGAQAYKLSDALTSVQAQIKNGPGPFACSPLGTIAAEPRPDPAPSQPGQPGASTPPPPPTGPPGDPVQPPQGSEATGMRLVCTAPGDIKLINGATATIEVVTARATQVLVAPVEAVAGGQGQGQVDVLGADGARQTRKVVLGLTDGKVIEIKSGLTGDETLAVPGPNLVAPPEQPGEPGGPGKFMPGR